MNIDANRVSRALIPVRALVKTKSLLKTIVSCLSPLTAAVGGLLIIGLRSVCFCLTYIPLALMYRVIEAMSFLPHLQLEAQAFCVPLSSVEHSVRQKCI